MGDSAIDERGEELRHIQPIVDVPAQPSSSARGGGGGGGFLDEEEAPGLHGDPVPDQTVWSDDEY